MHRCECYTEMIGRAEVREAHIARGEAECYMSFENFREANNFRIARA